MLFRSTHYHELTELEGELSGVKNYNIAAKKKAGGVIFLRKILRGGADQSYGIEVAKLAGVPNRVIDRAREILTQLETNGHTPRPVVASDEPQISLVDLGGEQVLDRLKSTDVNQLSPLEALNLLAELKRELEH